MTTISPELLDFFVEDTVELAPRDAKLPHKDLLAKSELWREVVVTFNRAELFYTNGARQNIPCYLYAIPLTPPNSLDEGKLLNSRVMDRMAHLLVSRCIRRVVWNFDSDPMLPSERYWRSWLAFLRLVVKAGYTFGVESLEIAISEGAGEYIVRSLRRLKLSKTQLREIRLKIRRGKFSKGGLALEVVKKIPIGGRWRNVKLHIEISNITEEGRKELERVSSAIASINFDRLTVKTALSHLIEYLRNTDKDHKIQINSFAICGKSEIKLPRGNVTLSIGAILRRSDISLSCEERLACLIISKNDVDRLSGSNLSINQLCITDSPSASELRRIRAGFRRVRWITEM